MGGSVYNLYISVCRVCVCVFNTAAQAFTLKVITSENLSPQSLLISLSFTGSEREGMIGLHPNVCTASGMLCVALQTHKVNGRAALQPTLLLLCLPAGICYLDLSPLSFSPSKLLEKLAEVFISPLNPYSRYPCQKD